MPKLPLISPELVESYQKEIEEKQSAKTAKRKTASLKRFFDWAKDEGHISQNPLRAPEIQEGVIITGGEKKSRLNARTFLMLGILGALIILIFLLARRVKLPIPFKLAPASQTEITEVTVPSPSPVPGGVAVLSPWTIFAKMTLADSSGNPITQAQTITFKLYTEAENNGGAPVWTSESKVLTPDANGNTLISLDNVPTDVFFQNKRLYLAPVTDGTEISQRIPISTANVASNLQEYYPALAAGPLTIPVINSDGALVLASQSPAVKGTAGNLLITGQAVTITTPAGASGNITVSPGGAGITKFIFGGASGNLVNASATNLTSGSLYYGVVANNATGYNLLTLQSGSSPLTRFSVDAVGNASVSGNLNTIGYVKTAGGYIQTGGNFSITQAPGEVATITKTGTALSDVLTLILDERGKPNSAYSTLVLKRYNGANEAAALYVPEGNAIFNNQLQLGRFSSNPSSGIGAGSLIFNTGDNTVYVWNGTSWSAVGSQSFWTMTNGLLYPINPSLDVAIGGTSTASAKFAFINVNSGTPTATISGNLALAVPTGADPAETLNIYNGGKLTVQTSVGGDVGLTSRLTILNGGNVGIGTTNPTTLLQLGTSGTTLGTLGLAGSTSGMVTVQTAVAAGTWTLTLPTTAGSSGYVLTTDGTGITTWTAASAIGTSWSSLTAPSTNLSMTMAAWTTTFTWNAATGSNNLFTFQDTTSNTGTGYLVNIATATSSTLKPFRVASAGTEALAINASGNVGIGTTTPVEKFEVSGNERIGQAPATATTINQVGGIGAGDVSVTVVSTTGYPSQGTLYIDNEAMTYTGTTATSFTGLTRGVLGTSAATHVNGSTVNNYIATFIANSTTPRMVLTGAGNLAVTGVGQFAGTITSPVSYSRFGTTASTNGLSTSSDLLISGKEELNGVFFLNSGNISNSQGTATIQFCITALCSVPSQIRNTLTSGSWLVRNTTSGNVGEAALQVDQDMVDRDIFTASASGSPKVTVAYSGNVGIGTTAPLVKLHAATDDSSTATVTDILQLNHSSTGTPANSFGTGLLFTGESTTTDARNMARIQSIWKTATDASRATALNFQTLTAAGSLTTQVTIDDVGNVGIGTAVPSFPLVVNPSNARIGIYAPINSSTTTNFNAGVFSSLTLSASLSSSFTAAAFDANMATVGAITVDNFAGLLARTPIPANSTITNSYGVHIQNQGASGVTNAYGLYVDSQSGAATNNYAAIFAGGNVGIGTTAPGNKLQVNGGITYEGVSGTNGNKILGKIGTNNLTTIFSYDDTANTYNFLSTNRYFDGTNWQQLTYNLRTGGNLYIVNDQLKFENFPSNSTTTTARFIVDAAGNLTMTGSKAGYVADFMENVDSLPLERGDIVASSNQNSSSYFSSIPIAKVVRADKNNRQLLGVVDKKVAGLTGNYKSSGDKVTYLTAPINTGEYASAATLGEFEYVKVLSTQNLTISPGTPITISSVPGIGVAVTGSQVTIGRALQGTSGWNPDSCPTINDISNIAWPADSDYSPVKPCFKILGSSLGSELRADFNLDSSSYLYIGKITVSVSPSWYDANIQFTSAGDLKIVNNQPEAQILNTKYQIQDTTGKVIDGIGAFGQLVVANIKAGVVEAKDITTESFYAFQAQIDNLLITTKLVSPVVETKLISPLADEKDIHIKIGNQESATPSGFGKLIVENASGSAVASVDEGGNATFSGTLYANKIESTTLDDINKLLSQVETDQNLLKQAGTWNINTATSSAKLEELLVSNLYVTSQAAVNSLSVSNSISLGNDFVIQPGSINTLTSPLSLQSLALAPIEIMAGRFRIETNGDVKIAGNVAIGGNLDIGGNLTASGSAQFSQVATNRLVIAGSATASGILTGSEIATNGTIGTAQVPANVSEISIKNPAVTNQTLVYVSPTSSTRNNVLYVKSKGDGFFTVGFENPLDIAVDFNWWVIETKQENVSQ